MANMLRSNIPIRFRNDVIANEGAIFECLSEVSRVKYKLNLEQFETLNASCLKEWEKSECKKDDAIDWLYNKYDMMEITEVLSP